MQKTLFLILLSSLILNVNVFAATTKHIRDVLTKVTQSKTIGISHQNTTIRSIIYGGQDTSRYTKSTWV